MACIVRLNRNGKYWLARWSIDGKRRHKSLGLIADLSRRGAEVLCRQIQNDLISGATRGTAPRLSEWAAQYSRLRTDLSPRSHQLLEHTTRYLLAFFDADPSLDRISPVEASEWRAALKRGELARVNKTRRKLETLQPGSRNRPYRAKINGAEARVLSDASVAREIRTAKRMFSEAVTLEMIKSNPFRSLSGRAPDVDKSWKTVTRADLERILAECPGPAWKCLFGLCRWAGLRLGESLRIQWQDVLWGQNKLMVNARERRSTKKRVRVTPIEPSRLPTGLTAILREAFELADPGAVHVCPGLKLVTLNQDAHRIIARAGLNYGNPFQTLRRNREAELAGAYPMHVFAEWQGHSPDVAARYYLRVEESLYDPPKVVKRGHKTSRRPA